MSPRPVTVCDLPTFDTLIDVRSPAEYAEDHIPGAINCPVLDDDERRSVGTTYVQVSAFEARKLGGAIVARRIAQHLEDPRFLDRPKSWRPLLYCWRGGQRSGSFVAWMRMIGWDAQALQGGYKSWRRHVIAQIDALAPRLAMRVLSGPTGSAKTRVLRELARRGEQVLDLEALAAHRGSVLGAIPGEAQPSQKAFETRLVHAMAGFDLARPVWVESESRRIGRLALPTPLLDALRAGAVTELRAPVEARLAHLLDDYAALGDDRPALADKLALLAPLHARETIERWQAWAHAGALPALFEQLVLQHYDPLYARSQRRDSGTPAVIDTPRLDEPAIASIAARLAAGS
ncbi:MAG TPA: tRNA 2-selenouridine(34) synthase MnmH [Methylibium sp.]|uniref:tRNA 2-selenouridine(34) synthase MnmH n=1 Tax=Methylibium sp. TaxID=2067992 RepID=UPI002DB6CDF7|nr:tRNA 2-selenouridine(34) synthase MnmH [Methylibium sp.]HEU4457737.1 tRNA 2-selenouridine(34) synthase MnmH [Methylibium sp.]